MKILIASDLHYPIINGVATFARNLARGLADNGHEVLVVAPSQTGKACKEVDGNHVIVRTTSIPFPIYRNIKVSLNPSREVKKIIEDFDPDVIHIQMLMWIGQAAMKYGNKYGIPVVTTNHAMPENLMDNLRLLAPVSRPITYILKAYGARFHSRADIITMPTESAISMFDEVERITTPVVAVSNGIDLSRFKPGQASDELYEKFNIPKDRPIVSYIGRLDAEKHLDVLVRAFVRVASVMPNTHLLVVGDGSEKGPLQEMIHEFGLDANATFTGRVSDEELVELHKIGTVYCMPSPVELQSIATLEAMASGQPIVAVDAGALGELCQHERNGYLTEQDDDEMIARGIIAILEDESLRQEMSQQSLEIAKTHDLQTTLKRFEEIYTDLTNA